MRETKFVGMEYFGSRDETTRRASLDEVDSSEVYVAIIAARYGSSITEDEYRRARSRGLPCLIYFKQDDSIPNKWRETDPEQTAKLDAFKRDLRDPQHGHIIAPDFVNPHDLAAKLTADLHRWLFDNYLTPKLEGAFSGDTSRAEAQALLNAVTDTSALNRDLILLLRQSGFSVNVAGRDVIHSNTIQVDSLTITNPNFFKAHTDSHEQPFDYEIYKESHWGDLKFEAVDGFLRLERVKKQEDYNAALTPKQQFEQFEFVRDGAKPTYGTTLCFGEAPNSVVAGCMTKCNYWRDSHKNTGLLESSTFKKNLISQFTGAIEFLTKYLRLERRIGQEGSNEEYEIPLVALREAVANALIHRVYINRNDPISVDLFEDRIEIKSPGKLPPQITVETLDKSGTYPRNPLVVRVFYLYGHVEQAGTGINRMTQAMLMKGLPPPEFKDGPAETFQVILRRPKIGSISNSSARHQLRAPVGDFVGRYKEISELTVALRSGGSAAISGISGMSGIGKTELALLIADRLRADYPDAQLLIDMRGMDDKPRDPADALAACIRAFVSLEAKLPDSLEDLTKLYRNILNGKRALILLDNAFDSAQVRPLVPPAGSALLVTSRNVVSLPRMTRVILEQLPPIEARELLTSIAPRVAPDLADQICFLCGFLPLAIRAAGSLLDVAADLDPADYAAQLRDERTRLELIGTEGVDVDVEASFNLSYARLSPDAARVFRQLAVFPTTFDAAAEEVICKDENHKHLSELIRRSLVLYDAASARYRLHDLARLFANARLSEEERVASQMRHAAHYLTVLRKADNLYLQGGEAIKRGLALFDLEWRNVQAGQMRAGEQLDGNSEAAKLSSDYPYAGAYLLSLRQHPRERIFWLETALGAARRLKDRTVEGVHLGNLGIAYTALGEIRRAIEFHERYFAIAREIGDRRGEGTVLGNLGNAYAALGETRRAVEFYEQVLAINRELGDRRREGAVLGNLGVAYAALGETRRAIEFQEQRLAIAHEIGDRLGEGQALGNLGAAHADLGEIRLAVEFYEQSLAIAREIGDRRGEGNALLNTGLARYKLGDRVKAVAHAEAALEIFEQIESPHAATVRAQLDEWRGQP